MRRMQVRWIALVAAAATVALLLLLPAEGRQLQQGGRQRKSRAKSGGSGVVETTVSSCGDLQAAFKDNSVERILVNGSIKCTLETWPSQILVDRDMEVMGHLSLQKGFQSSKQDLSQSDLGSITIDWSGLSRVLAFRNGTVAYFHDLVMHQSEMGIGGVNFAFFDSRRSSTALFAGIVMTVASCPVNVTVLNGINEWLPRPQEMEGIQRARVVGPGALLVEDVAVWVSRVESVWRICDTVFICNVINETDPLIAQHFRSELVSPICKEQILEEEEEEEEETEETEETEEEPDGK